MATGCRECVAPTMTALNPTVARQPPPGFAVPPPTVRNTARTLSGNKRALD
jgi:hypothetical protein